MSAARERRRHHDRHRFTWGDNAFRIGPLAGDPHVAQLTPDPRSTAPGTRGIQACVEALTGMGYRSVVTAALRPHEIGAFADAGFAPREQLIVLLHDLTRIPPPVHRTRRPRRRERPDVLAIDHAAFEPAWWMSSAGIDDAREATPVNRHRVIDAAALRQDGSLAGYSIIGRSGAVGYLQRVAVDPRYEGAGVGRSLVTDGLLWLRRRGARSAIVNTQRVNQRALALYRALGFVADPTATLTVMSMELP